MKRPKKTLRHKTQLYRYEGVVPYETAGGRDIELVLLSTRCPDCGRGFTMQAAKRAIKAGSLRRRCDGCKKPGVNVETQKTKIAADGTKSVSWHRIPRRRPVPRGAVKEGPVIPLANQTVPTAPVAEAEISEETVLRAYREMLAMVS